MIRTRKCLVIPPWPLPVGGLLLLVGGLISSLGCTSSPEIRYYTLAMVRSGEASPSVNLIVEQVRPTEALSRKAILILTSPTEAEYYASDKWLGNPSELVEQKLQLEFGPPDAERATFLLSAVLLACEQVDLAHGTAARVRLQVTIRDQSASRHQEPRLHKIYQATHGATARTPSAVVVALSECVEEIAVAIAVDCAF